jgi:hypothetical protein
VKHGAVVGQHAGAQACDTAALGYADQTPQQEAAHSLPLLVVAHDQGDLADSQLVQNQATFSGLIAHCLASQSPTPNS